MPSFCCCRRKMYMYVKFHDIIIVFYAFLFVKSCTELNTKGVFFVFFLWFAGNESRSIFFIIFCKAPECYFDLQVLANKETKNLFFPKRIDVAHHRC